MKGKLTTKTVVIGILIVILLAVATTATVIFLKDSGESSAIEGETTTPMENNANASGENQNNNNVAENNGAQGEDATSNNNEEVANQPNQVNNNNNNVPVAGNAEQEPAVTTIEQERVVLEETVLNWNNSGIGNLDSINSEDLYIYYPNLEYRVEYYYNGEMDEALTESFEGNKKGALIDTYTDKNIVGYELDEVENLPLTISENQENNIIKVKYTAKTDIKYTVEYYYEENGEYPEEPTRISKRLGTTDTEVSLVGTDKFSPEGGYIFDEELSISSGIVKGDGSLVLKVYYKEQRANYTVECYYEENGIYPEKPERTRTSEGRVTTIAKANGTEVNPSKGGYILDSQKSNTEGKITADEQLVLKIYFKEQRAKYTVECYYEENGSYPEKPERTRTSEGRVTTIAKANGTEVNPERIGYVLDTEKSNTEGKITADDKLVLKIYYKEQRANYTVEYYYENGTGSYSLKGKMTKVGRVGTPAKIVATDTTPQEKGYELNEKHPEYITNGTIKEDGSLTLKIYFAKQRFTVTFIDEDGSKINVTEYVYGTKAENIIKPEEPTKAATEEFTYTFSGWTPTIVDVTEDATYKAGYAATKNKYTVTFVDEDGKTVLKEATKYDYGTKAEDIVRPVNPTKTATEDYTYTFKTWTPAIVDVTEEATYKATYTRIEKADPVLELDQTVNKNQIIYNPDNVQNNTFTYTLKVWNTIENSKPVGTKTVEDTLPAGITINLTDAEVRNLGIRIVPVTDENGNVRQKLIWTIESGIGYGKNNAKTVNVPVIIDEAVFKGKETTQTSLDNVMSNISAKEKRDTNEGKNFQEFIGNTNDVALYVRFAGSTNGGHSGYLYAGSAKASSSIPNRTVIAGGYSGDIDANINNTDMLDTFVNSQNTMKSYISNLPDDGEIGTYLKDKYDVVLDENTIILWYKVCTSYGEKSRTRTYEITPNGGTAYTRDVNMPSCNYHLDGMIINISSLNIIPDRTAVTILNTATLKDNNVVLDSSTVSTRIHYKLINNGSTLNDDFEEEAYTGFGLLSMCIESDDINTDTFEEIVNKIQVEDNKNIVESKNTNSTSNSQVNVINTTIPEENVEEPIIPEENVAETTATEEINIEDTTCSEENVSDIINSEENVTDKEMEEDNTNKNTEFGDTADSHLSENKIVNQIDVEETDN